MKIALVSTPRSGNTWLRMLLASAYGLASTAVHDARSINWDALADGSIVQVHWPPEPWLLDTLANAGVQVLTIARHPLDVLISILHFCGHEPQTSQWLLGTNGNEDEIKFKAPTDPEFHRYATSTRAAALLSVSALWWQGDRAVKVRYESLVENPERTLLGCEAAFGPPQRDVEQVVADHAFAKLAQGSTNQHFWQGRPGIWKLLISRDAALDIGHAHSEVFDALGYAVDPPEHVGEEAPRSNWSRFAT